MFGVPWSQIVVAALMSISAGLVAWFAVRSKKSGTDVADLLEQLHESRRQQKLQRDEINRIRLELSESNVETIEVTKNHGQVDAKSLRETNTEFEQFRSAWLVVVRRLAAHGHGTDSEYGRLMHDVAAVMERRRDEMDAAELIEWPDFESSDPESVGKLPNPAKPTVGPVVPKGDDP